jgi:gliding motility associated protien GldN
MKRKFLVALLLLVSIGISTVLTAQTSGKKKKKKSKTTVSKKSADSSAVAPVTSVAKPVGSAPPPSDVYFDSTHSDGLVADTTRLSFLYFPLDSTRPVDGMYKIPLLRGAKAYPFPQANKYNIKFYKRIWRTIDLKDTVNKIFAVPGETMMGIIMDAIKAGKLIAYKDEGFKTRYTATGAIAVISGDSTVITDQDTLTGEAIGSHKVFTPFNPESINKFEIKEDIYFDKIRGRVVTQIIGLSPIKEVRSSTGEFQGILHPFYLYFPQCRNIFAGMEIFDTQRDVYGISYDDIFVTRNFHTRIIKESNPGDYKIADKYPNEEDQKREAERIERGIEDFKKNTWKY